MTESEFRALVGKNIIIDYPFGNELQKWNMRNFYINRKGVIKHRTISSLIMDVFIPNARNPHVPAENEC